MTLRPLALLLALGPAAAAAQPVVEQFEVPVSLTYGYGTDLDEPMLFLFETEPRLDLDVGGDTTAVVSARLRLDAEDDLEPGEPAYDGYSAWSKPLNLGEAGTLELRDAYLETYTDWGLLRVGKQQIVWGRLDGLKVLDVLNPQTFREFILPDLDVSRIGLWSAYGDISLADWRLELAWIPDPTGHDIPESGAWFELTAPRFRFGAPVGAPGLPTTTDRGAGFGGASAWAARLSRYLGDVDVAAQLYSGLDHEPLGRVRLLEDGPVVEQFYERRELLGLSAESAFGSMALRGELAFQPDRAFNLRDQGLSVEEFDQTTVGLGADISAPLDLFVNVQFFWDHVEKAPASLVRPTIERIATVFLRRGFNYETVQAELRWYHSLVTRDDTVALRVDYNLNDEAVVYTAIEAFSGDKTGVFGQFDRRDRLILGARYTF